MAGWRLHDFRRTCVTWLAGAGFAPHVADKLLNHAAAGDLSDVGWVYQRNAFLLNARQRWRHGRSMSWHVPRERAKPTTWCRCLRGAPDRTGRDKLAPDRPGTAQDFLAGPSCGPQRRA